MICHRTGLRILVHALGSRLKAGLEKTFEWFKEDLSHIEICERVSALEYALDGRSLWKK